MENKNRREWLWCGGDWEELIDIIKENKSFSARQKAFKEMLTAENISLIDIIENWRGSVLSENEILYYVDEWTFEEGFPFDDVNLMTNDVYHNSLGYWFYNIYTGQSKHVKVFVNVVRTPIIND